MSGAASAGGSGGGRGAIGNIPRKNILGELLVMGFFLGGTAWLFHWMMQKLDPTRQTTKQAAAKKKEIVARLGRPKISTNVYEDAIACDVINPDHISATFDSIGGLDEIKRELHDLVILPLKRPELFQQGKLLKPVKGVLLFGPPGTGKTLLAKAIAKESGACFINCRLSTLQSKWFGEAQKLVTAVFTLAYKLAPSIIFIDEIDSFLGTRRSTEHEANTGMKTEFMSLWDGITTSEDARVMVLGATNRPWEVDDAILRRLPRQFEVGLPDLDQRASILQVILRDEELEDDVDINAIAERTEGFSGSDLTEFCKQAAYAPIRDFLDEERRSGSLRKEGSMSTTAGGGGGERGGSPGAANGAAAGAANGSSGATTNGAKEDEAEEEDAPFIPLGRPRALRMDDFLDALQRQQPSGEAAHAYLRTYSRRQMQRQQDAHGSDAPEVTINDLLGAIVRQSSMTR